MNMAVATKKKKKTLQQQFTEQIRAFYEDNSFKENYDRFTPMREEVLVKLFKFIPETPNENLGKDTVLAWSEYYKEWKPSDQVLNEKIFPIVKILKLGKKITNEYVKEGELYTVPVEDIIGTMFNPEFMFLMNNFVRQGKKAGLADIPKDMDQRLPNLKVKWEGYKFSMPDSIDKEQEDDLVYLIPELKLKAIYNCH